MPRPITRQEQEERGDAAATAAPPVHDAPPESEPQGASPELAPQLAPTMPKAPGQTAEELGYGATAAHPQDATHYLGLYFMASRGARICDEVII